MDLAEPGSAEARTRLRVAHMYLEVAELATEEQADEARNVAAGNAVLAGIAASDAICCVRLGRRHRGQDHQGAVALLHRVKPEGAALTTVLGVKDGAAFLGEGKLKGALRAAARLVETAEDITSA